MVCAFQPTGGFRAAQKGIAMKMMLQTVVASGLLVAGGAAYADELPLEGLSPVQRLAW